MGVRKKHHVDLATKAIGIWLEVSQEHRFSRILSRGDDCMFLEQRRLIELTDEFQKQLCDHSVDNNRSPDKTLAEIKNIIVKNLEKDSD